MKVPDDWEEISREDNDSKDSDPPETSSDKEFQFIKNVESGQEAKGHALLKKQIGLLMMIIIMIMICYTPMLA